MKQLALFFFAAIGFSAIGQNPYIVSIDILPQNPTTNDEVFLATHVATGNLGEYLGSTVDVVGSTVTVESCYFEGWATQPQEYFDTISLGFFSSGNFSLNYTGYISWNNTNCDYQESNTQDTSFFVEQYVSVEEIDSERIVVYPNPSSSGDIFLSTDKDISAIELVDLEGNKLALDFSQLNGEYHVNLNSFAKGVYIIMISLDTKEVLRKRLVLI